MRRHVVFAFFVLFAFLFIGVPDLQAEEIRNFEANYSIKRDGSVRVEERISYDFGALQKHGIFRSIPRIKTNSEGKRFQLTITSISVENENRERIIHSTSFEDSKVTIRIGDPKVFVSGQQHYTIGYTVGGALTYFSDHDELYWNATGNEWTVPLGSVMASIEIEEEKKGPDGVCYSGLTGSKDADCSVRTEGKTTIITTKRPLSSGEGLTFAVRFPKGIVALSEPRPYVPWEESLIGKIVMVLIGVIALIWYLILPIAVIIGWYRWGRDPRSQQVRAWFDPPQDKLGRSLTPAETGTLIDETADTRDVFATIVHLAQRGYLQIEERKKNDLYLIKRSATPKGAIPLLAYEETLLAALFKRGATEVRVKDMRLISEAEEVKNLLYQQALGSGFFVHNPNTVRTIAVVVGVIALMTGNIGLAIVLFIWGRALPRKTILGAQQAAVGRSLKSFLSSQERQLAYQAKEGMLFEKLLPYAIAFGVERIWADRFKDIVLSPPDWYSGYAGNRFNSALLASSLHSSFSQFSHAITPTRSSSGFSSGFSGGSSGGGGGGGGGGSW